ncbi:hypothetical protein HNP87_001408 [Methanococcus maripaludis]|uniref:Uncharacterized protein n=1 Tax=Methanococcus maripaludis TaxID=39152 RepID=A0A7J9NIX6_METMI|nr:hypothetical protein [Methanococcus maripaludis]MBA2840876.1 hypothetical protein [Methanococcus maripaludis]
MGGNNLNNDTKDCDLISGLNINLDYKQKLYFHADSSLRSTINFTAGLYGAFITATIAIINISGGVGSDFGKFLAYASEYVLFFVFLNGITKSLVLEIVYQYFVKESLFKEMDELKGALDKKYGIFQGETSIYARKNFTLVSGIFIIYLKLNLFLMAISGLLILVSLLIIIGKNGNLDISWIFFLGTTLILSIWAIVESWKIYREIYGKGGEYFEREDGLWKEPETIDVTKIKQENKFDKKLILIFIALVIIGIYLKVKY